MSEIRGRWLGDPSRILMLLVIVFSLSRVWDYAKLKNGIDFFQLWTGGQSIEELKSENFYSSEFTLVHTATPFLYSLFRSFSSAAFLSGDGSD